MWSGQHSLVSFASTEAVWALWSNVPGWKHWDKTVEASSLQGGFAVGSTILIKPVGGPSLASTIVQCQPLQGFTNEAKLPFGRIVFAHELREAADEVTITHRVSITGLLTPLYARLIGKPTLAQLPAILEQLGELATGASATVVVQR
jgi:hypothetical protein